jgi:PEP-CTERM motif
MRPLFVLRWIGLALAGLLSGPAWGGYYPMYASWPQPGGPGAPITLTYSYSNLLDGSIATGEGVPLSIVVIKGAFEQALADYAAILPIHFVEVPDAGPLPETGPYDPTGLPDIRVGQVPHVDGANAYAYFPMTVETNGLAGDVVFNALRFGYGWTPTLFYGVAQHELGHSLGMGHYIDAEMASSAVIAHADYNGPLFPMDDGMVIALQGAYGAGLGSVTPLSAVPEPTSLAMLLLGLSLVTYQRNRKIT